MALRTFPRMVVARSYQLTSGQALKRMARGLRVHAMHWLLELLLLNASFALGFFVRYGGHVPSTYVGGRGLIAVGLVSTSYTVASLAFRSYRIVWRFAAIRDMLTLAATVAAAMVAVTAVELTVMRGDRPIPLSVMVIGAAMAYLAMAHLKLTPRVTNSVRRARAGDRLVVVGAGTAGIALVRQLQHDGGLRPVAFIDDDRQKHGRSLNGVPVLAGREGMAGVLRRCRAQRVAIAIASAPREKVHELARLATDAGARVMVVPSLEEMLVRGNRLLLREVGLDDLVGRSEVGVDAEAIRRTFEGKRVVVTGGAGSIGSEIARQLSALGCAQLVLVDVNESGLTELRDELPVDVPIRLSVADVSSSPEMRRVFDVVRPQVVVHAAALKHVDVVEVQPHEATRVNVLGTRICVQEAERVGTELFVFISTDKAVDPVGVLGASKRIGERLVTSGRRRGAVFMAVRFGNVLGSRGSVLPKFERQLAAGGPLTVTDPDVHRFFMSIVEAVRLVLQSAAMAQSGRIYVLDMGEEVAIAAFAQRLARLRGLRVPEDIAITFTGLRPGERLREKLVGDGECSLPTAHGQVSMITGARGDHDDDAHWDAAMARLVELLAGGNHDDLRGELLRLARPADLLLTR